MKHAWRSASFRVGLVVATALLCGLLFLHFGVLRARQHDIREKEVAWQSEQATVTLLTQMKQAQEDVSRVLTSLPTVSQLPQLSSFLSEEITAQHLPLPDVAYHSESIGIPGVVAVQTSLHLEGAYRNLRALMDVLERSPYFLVIQAVNLSRSHGDTSDVQMQLDLVSYMRES